MKKNVYGVEIDLDRDNLFDELGMKRLRESYMKDDETSPQERFASVSKTFSSNSEHAQRLYEYSSKHWLSYSTPILSFGRSARGLPISCFAAGTLVNTIDGLVPIEKLKVGDKVKSHDGSFNEITAIRSQKSDDLYDLMFEGEVFRVTGNHLVLTKEDGWVRVDALDLDRHNIEKIKD